MPTGPPPDAHDVAWKKRSTMRMLTTCPCGGWTFGDRDHRLPFLKEHMEHFL